MINGNTLPFLYAILVAGVATAVVLTHRDEKEARYQLQAMTLRSKKHGEEVFQVKGDCNLFISSPDSNGVRSIKERNNCTIYSDKGEKKSENSNDMLARIRTDGTLELVNENHVTTKENKNADIIHAMKWEVSETSVRVISTKTKDNVKFIVTMEYVAQ